MFLYAVGLFCSTAHDELIVLWSRTATSLRLGFSIDTWDDLLLLPVPLLWSSLALRVYCLRVS